MAADRGYFIQPTVFGDVQDNMTIAREEVRWSRRLKKRNQMKSNTMYCTESLKGYSGVMIFTELRNSTALGNRLAGLPHNKEASRVVSFVYLFRQSRQRYQMFDASKYVLGPYL